VQSAEREKGGSETAAQSAIPFFSKGIVPKIKAAAADETHQAVLQKQVG
jgi:hypothetical protein